MTTLAGDVHAVFIHGVGTQRAGYSSKARGWLAESLRERGLTLHAREVVWADILDAPEQKMLSEVRVRGSDAGPLQRLFVNVFADALSYPNKRAQIQDRIDDAFAWLRSDEVHVCAHSLGVLAAYDWLRDRPSVKLDGLTSFGCNLELFKLGGVDECPQQLDKPHKWRNAFYPRDMLGYAVGGRWPQVDDIRVSKPIWSVSSLVPGLSHNDYWHDKRLWSSTLAAGFKT